MNNDEALGCAILSGGCLIALLWIVLIAGVAFGVWKYVLS